MSDLFQVADGGTLFRPLHGIEQTQVVSFMRGSVSQTSAAETVLSFTSTGWITAEVHPMGGTYVRLIHGVVTHIDTMLYTFGRPDVRVGDRCTLASAAMEVVNIQQYGAEHAEIALHDMGR